MTNHLYIIGDVHAKFSDYNQFIKSNKNSIQVGDFGIGFEQYSKSKLDTETMKNNNHRFFCGNHDKRQDAVKMDSYIHDGYHDPLFVVSGALSIDKDQRIQGRDWWEDEELSQVDFYRLMDEYEVSKPKIMLTHDCPEDVYPYLKNIFCKLKSRTNSALSSFFYIHKPKIWIFGHHHQHLDMVIDGTRFICLPELKSIKIDLDSCEIV